MSGIQSWWSHPSYNMEEWGVNGTKAKLRVATKEDRAEYYGKKPKVCSVKWLLEGAWNWTVRIVNSVALMRGLNFRENNSRSIGDDPFLAKHRLFIPKGGMWSVNFHLASHPVVCREILSYHRTGTDEKARFFIGERAHSLALMLSQMFGDIGATSEDFILLCSKSKTKEYRNFLRHYFSPKMIKDYQKGIQEVVTSALARWEKNDGEINVTEECKLYACDVMSKLFLKYEGDPADIKFAVDTFSNFLSSKFLSIKVDEEDLKKASQIFREATEEARKKSDLAKEMDKDDRFTEVQMEMMIFTLFFAGVDNSSVSMTYLILKLAQNPELQIRIRKELEEGESKLLKSCLAESLRMFTPVHGITRVSRDDLILDVTNEKGGKVTRYIEKGERLAPCPTFAARNPLLYDNPDTFNPERFLDEDLTKLHKLPWLPFGSGTHVCPGWTLFEAEKMLFTEQLLKTFILSTDIKGEPKQIGRFLNKLEGDVAIQVAKE